MIPTQMLKGVLDFCILKIISFKPSYGYEIVQELITYGLDDISEGTCYPILLRLQKQLFVDSYYQESKVGPSRKYYQITKLGFEQLDNFEQDFNNLSVFVSNVFNNLKGEDDERD